MLKLEWNALRRNDRVLVHDAASVPVALVHPGVVAMVDCHTSGNGVGIRVPTSRGKSAILWPSYLAVHRDPADPSEPCWRCQAGGEHDGTPTE